jgi:hypothetical protein
VKKGKKLAAGILGFFHACGLAPCVGSAVFVVITLVLHPEGAELPEVVVPARFTEPAVLVIITENVIQGVQFFIAPFTIIGGSGHTRNTGEKKGLIDPKV